MDPEARQGLGTLLLLIGVGLGVAAIVTSDLSTPLKLGLGAIVAAIFAKGMLG